MSIFALIPSKDEFSSAGYTTTKGALSEAFESALNSPLLYNNDIYKSKKILFNIYQSENAEQQLLLDEMNEINYFMDKFKEKDIEVIWGIAYDPTLTDEVKITVLATGFGMDSIPMIDEADQQQTSNVIDNLYGRGEKKSFSLIDLTDEFMENDRLIDALAASPAYTRTMHERKAIMALAKSE